MNKPSYEKGQLVWYKTNWKEGRFVEAKVTVYSREHPFRSKRAE